MKAVLVLAVLGLVAIPATTYLTQQNQTTTSKAQVASGPVTFLETFDGNPTNPAPFSSTRWDIQVHERGMVHRAPGAQNQINAQHGMDCGAPPATHPVASTDQSVFYCRDHVMTALNGSEYGVIYLTPNHMLDWSAGAAVLSFDISTLKMSGRDWPDILLTPWEDQQALPLLSPLSEGVDLQGPPKNTISLSFATGEGAPILTVIRNGVRQEYGGFLPALHDKIVAGTNQAATRQPLKLTISSNHIRFERVASESGQSIVWFDQELDSLNFNKAVVQLGHHSYNPFKDNAGVAATWHWDNVRLSPAVPFTMLKANPRYIQESGTVTFPPAPANAILRFSAIGKPVVNGAARNPVTYQGHPEHFSSYNVPIPQGATSATIQMVKHDWYEHGYLAKDFSVWAQNAIGGVTTVPTNSPSPSISSALTPTPTGALSPSPSLSPSTSPTPSPSKTPTPTSVAGGSLLKIYAAGSGARSIFPTVRLQLFESGTWKNVKDFKNVQGNPESGQFVALSYSHPRKVQPANVRVRFTNDFYDPTIGQDRNVRIDKIEIDGVSYQSESPTTFSNGSWRSSDGCKAGYKKSEWLHCNGYFQYRQ